MEPKNILITGAGSGLGRGMAIKLASEGHNIILNGRTESKLIETDKLLKEYDVKTLIKAGDVSKSDFVESLINDIISEWDLLHVVINNAGSRGNPTLLIDMSEEAMQEIMDINFKGTWLVSKYAARAMKKQRKLKPLNGKIINVSSIAGKEPMFMVGIYSCSKAAIIMLTKALAKELAPKITVNAICPGYHITPMYNNDPNLIQNYWESIGMIPVLKKVGTAEDVAGLVSFLISDDSNYITGQTIFVDGGVTLGY